jgi:hypothetical protein
MYALDSPIRHRVNSLLASVTNLSIKDWHLSHKWIGMLRILQMKQNAESGLCRNSVNRLPLCCWSETDMVLTVFIRLFSILLRVQLRFTTVTVYARVYLLLHSNGDLRNSTVAGRLSMFATCGRFPRKAPTVFSYKMLLLCGIFRFSYEPSSGDLHIIIIMPTTDPLFQ